MQFVDLKRQYIEYKEEIDSEIRKVLDSCQFINGPAVKELEEDLSSFCGAEHVIACSSGTDALLISMMALEVNPGDEIIVPAFTFIATASMVSFLGAVPVFVDIDPVTFNINPDEIADKISNKTKGIIAVSLFGQCADFDRINEIAQKFNLWVIEDAAQSFGAEYKGIKSCNLTKIATTSFFPAKPLGCYGDGGAIFTSEYDLNEKIRMITNHGQRKRYYHKCIGINGRMDTIQAAVLIVKLKHFNTEIEKRNKIAAQYSAMLKDIVITPEIAEYNKSVWAQYTIQSDYREILKISLSEKDIPTAVHYPVPLSKQEAFKYIDNSTFQISETLADNVISLPMHPFLSTNEIKLICGIINEIIISRN